MGRRARGPDGQLRLERGPVAAGLACRGGGPGPRFPRLCRSAGGCGRCQKDRSQMATTPGFPHSARPAGGRRKQRTTVMRTQRSLVTGVAAAALVLVLASGGALTASAGGQPAGGSAWPGARPPRPPHPVSPPPPPAPPPPPPPPHPPRTPPSA